MSRKYMEAHASTGYSSKKVESKFGLKILEKMGWTEYKTILTLRFISSFIILKRKIFFVAYIKI